MSATVVENASGKPEVFLTRREWELLCRNTDNDFAVENHGVEQLRSLTGDEAAVDPLGTVSKGEIGVGADNEVTTSQSPEIPEPEREGAPIGSAFPDQLVHGSNGLGSEASFEVVADTNGSIGHEGSPVIADSEATASDDPAGIVQESTTTEGRRSA